MAKKLTREELEHMISCYPDNPPEGGEIVFIGETTKEDIENANAVYRVKYLHEDIDKVLAEVNSKREDDEKPEDSMPSCTDDSTGNSPKSLMADLFGGATLQDVEIEYEGMKIRIGHIDLQ